MRRLILLLSYVSIFFIKSFAQNDSILISSDRNDSIAIATSNLVDKIFRVKLIEIDSNRYKLYPTENIYNFLKLDTQTGRIDQIQWSLDSKKEFSSSLNREDLSTLWSETANSFELYPTQNMYQFILLDKATGRTWHVQWGLSDNKRWIKRIY